MLEPQVALDTSTPSGAPHGQHSGSALAPGKRSSFLAHVSEVLAASLDYERTIAAIAELAVPSFADCCSVFLLDGDGVPRQLALAHVQAERREQFRSVDTPTGFPLAALESGHTELTTSGEALDALGVSSLLTSPMLLRGQTLGALAFGRVERQFEPDDTAFAEDLAQRAVHAIEHARLYASERAARTTAERIAHRLERLQTVTNQLASALTSGRIAEIIIDEGVAAVGASTGTLYLLPPGAEEPELVRAALTARQEAAELADLTRDTAAPISDALRTGEAVFIETRERYAERYPQASKRARATDSGYAAIACLPLTAANLRLGALVFLFDAARTFVDEDRQFLDLLANHSAQALMRSRILEQERRYHERVRLLADAGRLLTSSLDYDTTLKNIIHLALPALGDFCFLDIAEESGEVRRISDAHQDHAAFELLAQTRWTRSERTDINLCALSSGRSGFHPAIDEAWYQNVATSPAHLELLRKLELCSMITVPLLSQGELLGALTLAHGRSGRHHSEADVALGEELASRAAQAVRHARLYRTSQTATELAEAAARQAEEASRLKDEFLATISHELRTPLSAILGWATLLRTKNDPAATSKGIAVIERNARSQLRLVEDILDVSRIVRGQLRLETEAVDLEPLVREVLEAVRPAAQAKAIELELSVQEGAARLVGDPERLRQVLWNLLSNAVKFTPAEGKVCVDLRQLGGKVVISVSDTGRGIEARFLPHVFQRFRQADASTTRTAGGLGLGLAIVRHLTEMHGGTVHAESEGPGKGATFTVSLPVKPFTQPVPLTTEARGADPDATLRLAPIGVLAGKRVMVVEDEDDARDLIQMLLTGEGAVVKAAPGAEVALQQLDAFAPEVLVSDIGMPHRDGYWLAREVRARRPDLPMVALTAYTRREDAELARSAGFDRHVAKPVDPERLVEIVASAKRERHAP